MASNGRQLSQEQRVALVEFMEDRDRGKASIFVGRKAELAHVQSCINRLLRRQDEDAPGADLTTVVQGAPGAGKSALLAKLKEDWPLGGKGQAVAVSLDPGALTLPMAVFLQAVVSQVERVPGFVRILRKFSSSLSLNLAGLINVEVDTEPSGSSGNELPPTPVILLFDEIQTKLAGAISDQSREHLTDNLRLLHTGEHKAPMFPVYGGLANSADLLRAAGLTRLAMGSELTLPGFSDGEVNELMIRFVEEHLSSARPSSSTLERWGDALRRDSQGWPMHCRNFLIALCEEIEAKDWRPEDADLDTVRVSAQQLRFNYYRQRMQSALEGRYALVATILDETSRYGNMEKMHIMDVIDKAHQDCPTGYFRQGALPEGVTTEQAFDVMLHAGIIQKTGKGTFACPIPSLASYIAARATVPRSALHEAVLNNEIADMDDALGRCRNNEGRGKLLQATDIRGRTPLILAVELGMALLVAHLVEAESRLPVALRSVECRDSEGRTVQDYAVASDDERIMALLERL